MTDDHGATVNEWVNIVRRAQLDRTTKLVALTLASYANPNGTKVYPGLDRLTVQCQIGYGTARRALSTLRNAGLVEVVQRGNRRRGRADEYRLILHADLLDRLEVLSPDEERAQIEASAERRRAVDQVRNTQWRRNQRSPEQTPTEQESTLTQTSVDKPINAHHRPGSTLTTDPHPP